MPLHGVRPFACHCEEVVATDEAISRQARNRFCNLKEERLLRYARNDKNGGLAMTAFFFAFCHSERSEESQKETLHFTQSDK